MRETNSTIFDGAIANENSFTELFRNFLKYKLFRDSFIDLFEFEFEFDKENVGHDDFDTQYTITKFGRPDLSLTTDESEILFEIKVYNTGLTKNQPTGYYQHLKEKSKAKNKGLVLLVPDNYYDLEYYESVVKNINQTDDKIHTQIIRWNQIAKIIADNELGEMSPLFYEYSNFLKIWFQLNSLSFDSLNATTMFGKEFPESLAKTCDIIDRISQEFIKRGFIIKFKGSKDWSEYGFYFSLPEKRSLFFGIWFEYWLNTGNPVCICLESSDSIQLAAFDVAIKKSNLNPAEEIEAKYYTTYIDKTTLLAADCEIPLSKILTEFTNQLQVEKVKEEIIIK